MYLKRFFYTLRLAVVVAALSWGAGLAQVKRTAGIYPVAMLQTDQVSPTPSPKPEIRINVFGRTVKFTLDVGILGLIVILALAALLITAIVLALVARRRTRQAVAANRKLEEEITQRTRAEETFRLVVESAASAMIMVNEHGLITLVNKQAEQLFGYTREGLLGQHVEMLVPERYRSHHPSHRSLFSEHPSTRAMGAGRNLFGLRKDGLEVPIEIGLNPIQTHEGSFVLASIIDITGRQPAEERFRQVIEGAPNGMLMVDAAGTITLVNAQIEKSFGYMREELLGQPIEMLVPEPFRAHHPIYRHKFMADPSARPMGSGRDLYGLRKDGSEFPVEIGLNPLRTEEGIMVLGTIVDITERKAAEEKLRVSETRFSIAFNASPISSVITTLAEGRYVAVNDTFLSVTGYTREEVIGHTSAELGIWRSSESRAELVQLLLKQGQVRNRETQYQMKDGNVRVFLTSAEIIEFDDQLHLITASVDITERKQAEEEVRRLNAELEQRVQERTAQLQAVNKELEAFSYSVSHDLRAPLRHINGFSQALLEDHADKLDEEGKNHLQQVRAASREMAQLIDDVLQLARMTRREMRQESVNLSELARSVVAELRERDAGRAVAVQIAEGLVTQGDKRLFRILLSNLIGNAWKFTSKRKQPEIVFGNEQKNGETVYFVRDNGAGFDMAFADKLFGVFQRLHTAHDFEGTGIGLATVQRIINRHGGRVWAEGAVNQGANFYFTVPDSKGEKDERQSDLTGGR
jgi:PAS domain S-box-containing protein